MPEMMATLVFASDLFVFCVGAGGEFARDSNHSPAPGDSPETEREALRRQDKGSIYKYVHTIIYADPLV